MDSNGHGPQPSRGANNKQHNERNSTQHTFDTGEACGGNISVTSIPKVIKSPGWDEKVKYPANSDCTWTFKTNWDMTTDGLPTIKFKIVHLELEDDIDCKYDYFEIKGHNRKLCGLVKGKEMSVNASEVQVHFRTDSNYEGKGFEVIRHPDFNKVSFNYYIDMENNWPSDD